jgi:hypothetical protein
VTAAGALTSTSGAIGGWTIGDTTISSSTLTIDSSGPSIRSGKTSYSSTATGFWIGLDSSTPKFNFGSSTQYIRWNGTALEINRPTLSTDWVTASLNPSASWTVFDNNAQTLQYARMGDFVFLMGWVKTTEVSRTTENSIIAKDLPKPSMNQWIYVRSSNDNPTITGGFGDTAVIEQNDPVNAYGRLRFLANAGGSPDNLKAQNIIINGWYKAAA